jgi:hypothetical protein
MSQRIGAMVFLLLLCEAGCKLLKKSSVEILAFMTFLGMFAVPAGKGKLEKMSVGHL